MDLKNTIKLMACASVLISGIAWSQQNSKTNSNCYVISKDIVGTGGVTNEVIVVGGVSTIIIGTGGIAGDVIGTGGISTIIIGTGGIAGDVIGTGGIATYCTNEIIGHGG